MHAWEACADRGSDAGGIRSMQGVIWDECVRSLGAPEGYLMGTDVVQGKYARRSGLGLPG